MQSIDSSEIPEVLALPSIRLPLRASANEPYLLHQCIIDIPVTHLSQSYAHLQPYLYNIEVDVVELEEDVAEPGVDVVELEEDVRAEPDEDVVKPGNALHEDGVDVDVRIPADNDP